jgi:hypothetical protein
MPPGSAQSLSGTNTSSIGGSSTAIAIAVAALVVGFLATLILTVAEPLRRRLMPRHHAWHGRGA